MICSLWIFLHFCLHTRAQDLLPQGTLYWKHGLAFHITWDLSVTAKERTWINIPSVSVINNLITLLMLNFFNLINNAVDFRFKDSNSRRFYWRICYYLTIFCTSNSQCSDFIYWYSAGICLFVFYPLVWCLTLETTIC